MSGTLKTIPTALHNVIPVSSRLHDANALAQDVWSMYHSTNLPSECIDLGQGHMNFGPPKWITNAGSTALEIPANNHYSQPKGCLRLREAIKQFYGPQFSRTLDAESEILVTSGATEGLYSVCAAFLESGDEVILFEPYFDQYLRFVMFNGGKPIYVPLHPPPKSKVNPTSADWKVDFEELRNAITTRTKMIILNTPHNPVGKVFTQNELEKIAAIAEEFNLLVVADEVYDCIVFDDKPHIRIANLPGMWNRTVTVGSAGKSFAATGWRVGWLIGPVSIIKPALAASTRIIFCTNSPLQEAAAAGLEKAKEYKFFETQLGEYAERRDLMAAGFDRLGLKYIFPEGGYFVLLDISRIKLPYDYSFPEAVARKGRDFQVTWFIAMEIGVSSIPTSEFYCEKHSHIGENYARFAFCKDVETLRKAMERLEKLKNYIV